VGAVLLEGAGESKFTELVANHIFGHEDRAERPAIVHADRESDELRSDGGTAGPGLDRGLGLRSLGLLDLGEKMTVDERTFFEGTCHMQLTFASWGGRRKKSTILQHMNEYYYHHRTKGHTILVSRKMRR